MYASMWWHLLADRRFGAIANTHTHTHTCFFTGRGGNTFAKTGFMFQSLLLVMEDFLRRQHLNFRRFILDELRTVWVVHYLDVIQTEAIHCILCVLIWWNDQMASTKKMCKLFINSPQRWWCTDTNVPRSKDGHQGTINDRTCASILLSSFQSANTPQYAPLWTPRNKQNREITDHQNPFQFHLFPHNQTSIASIFGLSNSS